MRQRWWRYRVAVAAVGDSFSDDSVGGAKALAAASSSTSPAAALFDGDSVSGSVDGYVVGNFAGA